MPAPWGHSEETLSIGKLAGLVEFLPWVAVVTAAVLIRYFSDPC